MAKEIKLNATVSNICKFEKNTGKSLITAFNEQNMSLTTIIELIKAISVEPLTDADIDEYVKDQGIEGLTVLMNEALQESGFLPKTVSKPLA